MLCQGNNWVSLQPPLMSILQPLLAGDDVTLRDGGRLPLQQHCGLVSLRSRCAFITGIVRAVGCVGLYTPMVPGFQHISNNPC